MYKELSPFSESTDITDSTVFFFWDTLLWKHVAAAAAPLHTPVFVTRLSLLRSDLLYQITVNIL